MSTTNEPEPAFDVCKRLAGECPRTYGKAATNGGHLSLALRGKVFLLDWLNNQCFRLDIFAQKWYTLGMRLNDRQLDIRIALAAIAKVPISDSWGDFIDMTRAIASMVEGAETLVHPTEMQTRFAVAWQAYAKMWSGEHNRIIRDCLGSQAEFDRVKSHPNGRTAINRILQRVKEVHGKLTPGMEVNVSVDDILVDELTEDDFGGADI